MPPTRVHLVRHGQGQHNIEPLAEIQLLHDSHLTNDGVQRCKQFNDEFPKDVLINLVCASPMRRTIQTASHCFRDTLPRTNMKKILLLPDAQETTDLPCDTGSPKSALMAEFGDVVDACLVTDGWTSKAGAYGTDAPTLRARAKALRQWLKARPEREVVVVSHGAILDYVVEDNLDEDGVFQGPVSGWGNGECRFYHFVHADTDQGRLLEEEESLQRRE